MIGYTYPKNLYNWIYLHKEFVRTLETGEKASLWQAFLVCFRSSANEVYFTDNVFSGSVCMIVLLM
jgi:hypothetical protein